MSGSETGVLTNNNRVEPFGVGLQKSPITPPQPAIQNMRLAFSTEGSAVYKPVNTTPTPTNNNNINSPSYHPSSSRPAAGPVGGGGGGGGVILEGSASATRPPHGINVNSGTGGEPLKRKRGRPRKYGPDGSMALSLVPAPKQPVIQPQQQQQQQQQPSGGGGGFASATSPPPATAVGSGGATGAPAVPAAGGGATPVAPPPPSVGPAPSSLSGTKKARGRPPGSSNKKQHVEALGPGWFAFTPHVVTVKAGEDISSQIMSFSQHGPRAICILSATGAISNVTLRQPSTSGGTVTYEGRFEIINLTGSFMPLENGGHWGRTGGLSVSLSGSDGRVLGGCVAGLLIAATPIQLIVASFIADGGKEPKSINYMDATAMGRHNPAGPSSPPSRGTLSESSGGGPGSPVHQNSGPYNNSNPQGISSMSWK